MQWWAGKVFVVIFPWSSVLAVDGVVGAASHRRDLLLSGGGISFCGGEGSIELGSKISMYVWKLFYLLTPVVRTKYLFEREHLSWTLFLILQYFHVYEIAQFCKHISFSQRNTRSKYGCRFVCIFWCKISFISENKSKRNIQTPTFAKISIGKNIAA